MLWQRIITAMFLVPPVILGTAYADTHWIALVTGMVILLGALEWTRLANISGHYRRTAYVFIVMICLIGSYLVKNGPYTIYIVYAGVIWWAVVSGLIIRSQASGKIPANSRLNKLVFGILTLVPAWLSLVLLHGSALINGRMLLIYLFILIWTADIAGYFCGKKWGRHALATVISPGKTWEGVAGAMVACALLSIVFSINKQFQLSETIIFLLICLLTVSVSIIGDLMESLLKRSVKLKDSGHILPGHGGVLDRIDSFLAACPVFLIAVLLLGISA